LLGNDVVDIDFCEAPVHRHIHYLDRVCTPGEADSVRRSANPLRALAVIWASKEAAYKMFSKQSAPCHFVPRHFVAQIGDRDPVRIDEKLSVLYCGVRAEVSIFSKEKWVHAAAVSSPMNIHWLVREIEHCFFERRKARSESEAVRFLVKALLDELGLRDLSLQFDGRVPRLMRNDGGHSGTDVSLSHHGAFAAAAVAWPAHGRPSPSWVDAGFEGTRNLEAVCFTCTA
jgi:phosphopantetheinyl transferase (holo-ACP synthase)